MLGITFSDERMYLSINNGIVGFLRVLTNPKRAYSNPALQSCRNSKGSFSFNSILKLSVDVSRSFS